METLENLQTGIQRDLAWRKREISDIRSLALRAQPTEKHIFRAGQVMLCAHWEGFLKKSAEIYLQHVFAQPVRLRDLTPNVVAAAFFSDVMQAAKSEYPGSEENHIKLAKRIIEIIDAPAARPTWNVRTAGNPGTDVVERVLKSIGVDSSLGMDSATWSTTRIFINEQLVRDRHSIAHGDGLPIVKDSFLERADRVLGLLDQLADVLIDEATSRSYLVRT